jgi:WD40 repeat protein
MITVTPVTVGIWDADRGQHIGVIGDNGVMFREARLSPPSGRILALDSAEFDSNGDVSRRLVKIFTFGCDTPEQIATLDPAGVPSGVGNAGLPVCMLFSPDGRYLLTYLGESKGAILWRTIDWKKVALVQPELEMGSFGYGHYNDFDDIFRFSPDGKILLALVNTKVIIWKISDLVSDSPPGAK